MGEKFGRDSIWETHLAEQLWHTEVELLVVLDEHTMRLSDVIALKPGQRIVLNVAQGDPLQVRCGNVVMFEGRVGQKNNHMAVKIERVVQRPTHMERG